MIAKKVQAILEEGRGISQMFGDAAQMIAELGAENVYNFSIGNPSVEPPEAVKEAIIEELNTQKPMALHSYTGGLGYADVRKAIADNENKHFGTNFGANNVVMTVGAAGGLSVIFQVLLNPGDQVITFAPYFSEYKCYAMHMDAELVLSGTDEEFQPKLDELESKINEKTRIILINSPNNPTGAVYPEETLRKISDLAVKKGEEYGAPIYIVSDEPYRYVAYDGVEVPYLPNCCKNAIVGNSFSKSLSLPGERLGFLVIPSDIDGYAEIYDACNTINRTMGFVNAPSLIQKAVAKCLDAEVDVEGYKKCRDLLWQGLVDIGYECFKPQGAFYLFMKCPAPVEDDWKFYEMAKKYQLVLGPGSGFGGPGYVRISYCVDYHMIEKALPKFKELWDEVQSLK
ncbi:MAG: pyridoxal phosphate-dependent aminotransferase [Firmicutes bacterium]|nr:pyridoxal phosphate-dependent aminotransferase [Bacillota bacterium]